MKKTIITFMSVIMLSSLSGHAFANDILGGFFGNTLTVTLENGEVINWYYNEDGTYSNSTGESGEWSIEGTNSCIIPEGGDKRCYATEPGRGVGDTWEVVDPDGSKVTITVTTGR